MGRWEKCFQLVIRQTGQQFPALSPSNPQEQWHKTPSKTITKKIVVFIAVFFRALGLGYQALCDLLAFTSCLSDFKCCFMLDTAVGHPPDVIGYS